MTEVIVRKLNDSPIARWTVLILISVTMFFGYFVADVMAPLMDILKDGFGWTASEYGAFNMAYGWLNVFLFMLIIGGIIVDKLGSRRTGVVSCFLMIFGCGLKYYAISRGFEGTVLGMRTQVFYASLGYAIFGFGVEMSAIIVTKVIVRWFKGREMALAMGVQVAVARLGTGLAISATIPLSDYFGNLSAPILLGMATLCIGLITFLLFCVIDCDLDVSLEAAGIYNREEAEKPFRTRDVISVVSNKGFWLITLLCLLFYSAVFPFLKYATSLMINKYNVAPDLAGNIPAILPFGTILLTPLFGRIYDKRGKGLSMMLIGTYMLVVIHALFAVPFLDAWWFAAFLMAVFGVAFSLVPSALWPSVPKIIPHNQLGTAYSLIFWIQNIGLSLVPYIIGKVLDTCCLIQLPDGRTRYDYTISMIIFMFFAILAVFVALMLRKEDKIKGYGLEKPITRFQPD